MVNRIQTTTIKVTDTPLGNNLSCQHNHIFNPNRLFLNKQAAVTFKQARIKILDLLEVSRNQMDVVVAIGFQIKVQFVHR